MDIFRGTFIDKERYRKILEILGTISNVTKYTTRLKLVIARDHNLIGQPRLRHMLFVNPCSKARTLLVSQD